MRPYRRFSAAEIQAGARRAASILADDPRVEMVYLFGSGADGSREAKDLDLAIMTKAPLELEALLELRARVVEEVHLPIDLIPLNEASVILRHEIVETGRCLYARRPELETDFVVRSRARYWDFAPFFREQKRLARLRSAERGHDP